MFKAMVVDDDVAVLQFFQAMIPWKDYGFQLTVACTNAQEALLACEQSMPDLVITDIGMPGMSGLDLIREMKRQSGHPRFLILSCHDEFKYAQQAVQLGVQDYFLKETLDASIITDVLERLKGQMENEAALRHQVEKMHVQASRSKLGRKSNWLFDFMNTPMVDPASWKSQLAEFGMRGGMDYYIPAVCSVYRYQEGLIRYSNEQTLKFIMDNALEELLHDEPNLIHFSYTAKELCFLFACRKDLKHNPYDQLENLFLRIQHSLSKTLKIHVSMLVGEMDNDILGLKKQFAVLLQLAPSHFFYSARPEIVKSNQLQSVQSGEELLSYYSEYADRINRLIWEGSQSVEPTIDDFIHFIEERRFHPVKVKPFLLKLLLDIQVKLTLNHPYNNEKQQHVLDNISHMSELKEWMSHSLEEAVSVMEQISKKRKKTEIIDAQSYIQLHLHRKIALEEVADHLYLNASYFSRLFKKETGETFVEYITRLKMEKAKELVDDPRNTVEGIALALGYDNKSYFVKLFKKHYGVPPSMFV
ncbi:response regulator [Paenibacillaceae bacterium]|nr:response regulator [Paenibacillaceae bacterium]